jgi:excisionase family DNA binding protein
MSAMSQIPGYLTLAEAARVIGVSHAQASRYVGDGALPHAQVGSQYLIPEEAARSFERPPRGNPAFRTNKNPAIQAAKKKKRKSA